MVSLEPVLIGIGGRLKSTNDSLRITTTELGGMMGVSQQTASRYINELEANGWIERRRFGKGFEVKLTQEGVMILKGIYGRLGSLLESKNRGHYEGRIVSGIGQGAYYIKEYAKRIRGITGYEPYPGTLNVKFDEGRPDLTQFVLGQVDAFKTGNRTFGKASLTPVTLTVRRTRIMCHAIVPERTFHDKDLELISKHNLRRKYGIKDGDKATVTL
ncbi:MAG: DUF120 domain-containing protein [Candidatus Altiarchaeota archaeon]